MVHFHGWTKALSTSTFRTVKSLGLPSIVTLHDYFAACPNGGFYDYQQNAICTRRAMGASGIAFPGTNFILAHWGGLLELRHDAWQAISCSHLPGRGI